MGRKVFVVGVGMTKFEKPGSREWDYPDMVKEAGTKALEDAVHLMFALKYEAIALMHTPVPGKRHNAGPEFRYVSA